MTNNAFAIARRLVGRGVTKPVADAVTEEIVSHSDDSHATKADLTRVEVRLSSDIVRVETKVNVLIALNIAVIAAILVAQLTR